MAIWRRANTPIREVAKPTGGHRWLKDDYGNMVPYWFDGDCLPKLLIDDDDDNHNDDDIATNESNDSHNEN